MRLHSSSDVAPVVSVVKFGGHLLQVELIVLENIPLGHGMHSVEAIKKPGGHLHELIPMLFGGDTVPRGQSLQDAKS
jgi:hypothetical protein